MPRGQRNTATTNNAAATRAIVRAEISRAFGPFFKAFSKYAAVTGARRGRRATKARGRRATS